MDGDLGPCLENCVVCVVWLTVLKRLAASQAESGAHFCDFLTGVGGGCNRTFRTLPGSATVSTHSSFRRLYAEVFHKQPSSPNKVCHAVFLTLYVASVHSSPVSKQFVKDDSSGLPSCLNAIENEAEVRYLINYGYMKSSANVCSEQEIMKSTRKFQKSFGLETTGIFDTQTLALMKTPRCGIPDYQKIKISSGGTDPEIFSTTICNGNFTSVQQKNCELKLQSKRRKRFILMGKWPSNKLTYGFRSYAKSMTRLQQDIVISKAFQVWTDETTLQFEPSVGSNADIVISFKRGVHNDGYPFDGAGNILAHAFFPGPNEQNGDIHFDDDEEWSDSYDQGTNLLDVAMHEIGHSVGLGHSSNPDSVMLPFYQRRRGTEVLGADDKMAVNFLYGKDQPVNGILNKNITINAAPTSPAEDDVTNDDVCDFEFDAVANVRKEIFFFRKNNFWRFTRVSRFDNIKMKNFWTDFPDVNVDAVFVQNRKTFIFSGTSYWTYTDNSKDKLNPKPISDFGLPMEGGIDAAFLWSGVNDKVYFVKNNTMWKYDLRLTKEKQLDLDKSYSKKLSDLGISPNIDGAFINPSDGQLYFLKGKHCWMLNKNTLKVIGPEKIGQKWFKCKKSNREQSPKDDTEREQLTNVKVVRGSEPPTASTWPSTPGKSAHQSKEGNGMANNLFCNTFLFIICLFNTNLFLSVITFN